MRSPTLSPLVLEHVLGSNDAADATALGDAECTRRAAERLDSSLHALAARAGLSLSPVALALAWGDWALQLATQPARAAQLGLRAWQAAFDWGLQLASPAPVRSDDPRLAGAAWQRGTGPAIAAAAQAVEHWWDEATQLRGLAPHHREMTRFFARQGLDLLSPANWGLLNPEVAERTLQRGGANLAEGWQHAIDGWRERQGLPRLQTGGRQYRPGIEVAVTPGQVVYRNGLVELIQYLPLTASVEAEPVFIVPSWIMKYYILDLSPHNSMVRWLVEQGHTVYILSWRNPDERDALLGLDDYLQLGVFDALAAIGRMLPGERVHACGYCLGGTLLSIAAAAMARPGGVSGQAELPALASLSLLAAETDFTEPGEMGVLIDEAQVALLEDVMAERSFLTGPQMAASFQFLHSRELVWSQALRELWLGEPGQPNDLMAWNADTTRMPAVMHSEYLRRCYLRNELAEGRFPVDGRPVALQDLHMPLFVVGTEKDHVSPWRSVYKLHRLCDAELTFVLTSGGHNAGIVSEPGHAGRHHAIATRPADGPWLDPEAWRAQAERREGSWWTSWHDWLRAHGDGRHAKARTPAAADVLDKAPGRHVLQRYAD